MCWPRQTKSPRLSIINFEKVKVKRLILKSESENMFFLYHTSCASPTHNIPHHCCQKLILDLILIDVCMQQNVFPNHAGILCFGSRICNIFVLFLYVYLYLYSAAAILSLSTFVSPWFIIQPPSVFAHFFPSAARQSPNVKKTKKWEYQMNALVKLQIKY